MPDTKLQSVLHELFTNKGTAGEFTTFSDPGFDITLVSLHNKLILFTVFLGIIICPIFSVLYYCLGDIISAAFCTFGSALAIFILILIRKTRKFRLAREILLLGSFSIVVLLSVRLGGSASPIIMWLAICPTIAMMTGGYKSSLIWTLISTYTVVGLYVLTKLQVPLPVSPIPDLNLLNTASSTCLLLVFFLVLLGYERVNMKLMRQLDESYHHIKLLATIDELTGALNRRETLRRLEIEISRSIRTHVPLSICIMDIDHFKRINDDYGHASGDQVLSELSEFIESEIRQVDIFGRYGGEEFLLLLPNANLELAQTLAERLREKIAAKRISCCESEQITFSIGLTEYRMNERASEMIARADQALYEAKQAGRNRISAV